MKFKRALSLIMIIVVAASLFGCGDVAVKKEKYSTSFYNTFDTLIQLIAYEESQESFDKLAEETKQEFIRYSHLYDIYNDFEGINNVKTINDNAGIAPVEVDQDIIDMLQFGKDLYTQTDGNINIAFGAVLSLWHFARETAEENPDAAYIPAAEDLQAASLHCNIDDLIIDNDAKTVYLADPLMSLDVGSIGKGFATERISEKLQAEGYDTFLISAGSSSIKAIGVKPDKSNWTTAIETDPDFDLLKLNDCSITTSGNYQRYFILDGERYHHIINKDTLMPENNFTSVTLICEDCALGDGLATAVYNMPLDDGMEFINSLDGVYAMWVLTDNSKVYSEDFDIFKAS